EPAQLVILVTGRESNAVGIDGLAGELPVLDSVLEAVPAHPGPVPGGFTRDYIAEGVVGQPRLGAVRVDDENQISSIVVRHRAYSTARIGRLDDERLAARAAKSRKVIEFVHQLGLLSARLARRVPDRAQIAALDR